MNTDLVYKELKRFFNNDDVNARFVVTFIIDEQYEDIDVREDEKVLRKNITNKLDFSSAGFKSLLMSVLTCAPSCRK